MQQKRLNQIKAARARERRTAGRQPNVRYAVSYIPTDRAEALAANAGWTEGASLWDFIEPHACERIEAHFTDLPSAFARARQVLPEDVHGEPRILRQEYRPIDGEVSQWCDAAYWLIYHDTTSVDPDEPDGRYED
jgi:hypothetical protein